LLRLSNDPKNRPVVLVVLQHLGSDGGVRNSSVTTRQWSFLAPATEGDTVSDAVADPYDIDFSFSATKNPQFKNGSLKQAHRLVYILNDAYHMHNSVINIGIYTNVNDM